LVHELWQLLTPLGQHIASASDGPHLPYHSTLLKARNTALIDPYNRYADPIQFHPDSRQITREDIITQAHQPSYHVKNNEGVQFGCYLPQNDIQPVVPRPDFSTSVPAMTSAVPEIREQGHAFDQTQMSLPHMTLPHMTLPQSQGLAYHQASQVPYVQTWTPPHHSTTHLSPQTFGRSDRGLATTNPRKRRTSATNAHNPFFQPKRARKSKLKKDVSKAMTIPASFIVGESETSKAEVTAHWLVNQKSSIKNEASPETGTLTPGSATADVKVTSETLVQSEASLDDMPSRITTTIDGQSPLRSFDWEAIDLKDVGFDTTVPQGEFGCVNFDIHDYSLLEQHQDEGGEKDHGQEGLDAIVEWLRSGPSSA
jgi:hypothetical protein